jgi:hypothetical protein
MIMNDMDLKLARGEWHFDHERIPERIARAFESDRPQGSGPLARHLFCRNRIDCILPGKHRSRHHVREAIAGHLRYIDSKPSPALQIIGTMKETLRGRAYG